MTNLGEHSNLTSTEISVVVKMAVRDTLEEMGLDLSTPAGREGARKDFAYVRASREGGERMGELVKRSGITVVLGGMLFALWQGIKLALSVKGIGQ